MCHEAVDSGLHQTFNEGLNQLLQIFGSLQNNGDDAQDRQQALVQYSLMVGALTLARATRGEPLSDEILEAARCFLSQA